MARFLLMSTVKAMGEEEAGTFDETSPANPASPYGISKFEAEQCLLAEAPKRDIQPVIIRLPMVYGPGAKGNVLKLLDAARQGRKLPFGCISNQRSMVYVGNVVDGALAALFDERSTGEIYLLCDERPYSTRELYAEICKAMGQPPLLRNVPVWMLRAMGLVGSVMETLTRRKMPVSREVVKRIAGNLTFRAEKIREQLGYQPRVKLAEGIADTVAWYLDNHAPASQPPHE